MTHFVFPTLDRIKEYKEKNGCSMTEASQHCFGASLVLAISTAESIDDLKDILIFMAVSKSLY